MKLHAGSACAVEPRRCGTTPDYYYRSGYYERDYGRPTWCQ
jgi:hypothetical protein